MASISDDERQLFLQAVSNLRFQMPVKSESKMKSTRAKKRKKNGIDAVLDLHGCTRETANFRLRVFIERCILMKKRHVLIIHGKGGGILRQEVQYVLANSREVKLVVDAPVNLGGDGAVVVDLL